MNICPVCGSNAVYRCTCGGGELVCNSYHVWTWCEKHNNTRELRRGELHGHRWPLSNQCNCPQKDGFEEITRFIDVLKMLDDEKRKKVILYAEDLLKEIPKYDNEKILNGKLILL